MAQVPLREHYDSDEQYQIELDIYLTNLDSNVDGISSTMGTASTGTDDEAYPTVDGLRLGYQERYLATRYGTSATGADFTDDYTTIVGLTVYQGLRNSDVSVESNNPADYTWRELNVATGWIPSYRIAGGRLVDWDFSATTPDNYLVDNVAGTIDLDNFAAGQQGEAGADATTPRVEAFLLPASTSVAQAVSAYDAQTLDFATFRSSTSGLQFRNDDGSDKAMVASVRVGGNDASQADHYTYTYSWTRNGLAFTPAIAGQSLTRRFLVINADDIADGGEDVILCNISST